MSQENLTCDTQTILEQCAAEELYKKKFSTDPFEDTPMRLQKSVESKSKAATKSRINQLTVGDVRYIFTQLRGCRTLDPNLTLWTGKLLLCLSLPHYYYF
jgi:hypothetical protein